MNLTMEQIVAVKNGESVHVEVEHTECVLVRRDVYERVRKPVEYDDSPWSVDEMDGLAAEAAEALDRMGRIEP